MRFYQFPNGAVIDLDSVGFVGTLVNEEYIVVISGVQLYFRETILPREEFVKKLLGEEIK